MRAAAALIDTAKWLPVIVLTALAAVGCAPSPPPREAPVRPEERPERDRWDEPVDRGPARVTERHAPKRPAEVEGVPPKVFKVLRHVDEHHRAPEGYEGGRDFHNAERRLPTRDADGRPTTYHEWDVNPKVPGVNRGPERLVTGSDGSAFYTPDHYRTFIRIR